MRDVNLLKFTGSIFWSKLDDKQSYSILRLGVKLTDGSSCFCSINNPNVKTYDIIKPGNKILISSGYLDTWTKDDGSTELQIKANDSGVSFFTKEKALPDINSVSVIGKILSYSDDTAEIEMFGDRNPKTNQPTVRKAKVRIGNSFGQDIVNNKIVLEGKIVSTDVDGKSKVAIEALYDKLMII